METARDLRAPSPPFPSKTICRSCASSASPVPAVTSMPLAQKFPASVLLQEQCDEYKRSSVYLGKRKHPRLCSSYRYAPCIHRKTGTTGRRLMATGASGKEEDYSNSEELVLPPLQTHTNPSSSSTMESAAMETEKSMDVEASSKKALSGSIQNDMLDTDSKIIVNDLDGSQSHSWTKLFLHGEVTVRSIRYHERRSKKRRVVKLKGVVHEMYRSRYEENLKVKEGIERDGTLKSLLSCNRIYLTAEEELELIARSQDLLKLKEVKNRLKSDIGREPTLVEWSKEVGISCRELHSRIRSGIYSQNKLIRANLWLMADVAKVYLYCGLSHMELFPAGMSGLLRSIEKFDPAHGCRFSTYAFWWIREAVYRNGVIKSYTFMEFSVRTHMQIDRLSRVRRLCIEEEHRFPTKEEIAGRMDITVDRLEKLLVFERLRNPSPIDILMYLPESVEYMEDPEETIEKEEMIQHISNLLATLLTPRERQAVILRYGLEDGRPNPLSEIGIKLGISRERARQLEENGMQRLRQRIESEGLMEAYKCLAVLP
uniref:Sigma factor n=1 Tax=California macrophylla TaxID=337344 RepID=A0A0G2STV0_9ROSI|nr:sigma factor [California macrophylla]